MEETTIRNDQLRAALAAANARIRQLEAARDLARVRLLSWIEAHRDGEGPSADTIVEIAEMFAC